MNRHLEQWDADVTVQAAYGLEPPKKAPVPAVTRDELAWEGIPLGRVEEIYAKVADWAARNPDRNDRETLLALARGYLLVR